MSCAIALVGLSLGYLVYLHASKEKEGVKLLGQVIGIFVMIAAVICMLCFAGRCMTKNKYGLGSANCSMAGKTANKTVCPMSGKLVGADQS